MPHKLGHLPDENSEILDIVKFNALRDGNIDLVNKINAQSLNAQSLQSGASGTNVATDFSNMGTLGQFMQPAMAIMDDVYKLDKPTQREKDINMGRMFLKFFTEMGARASVPGATALGAGVQAGQSLAEDYLNKAFVREETKKKTDQAKRLGAVNLAMQLKSADDAKKLAEIKLNKKTFSKPDTYKILNAAEVKKALNLPFTNPQTGQFYKEGDIISLTAEEFAKVPRGNLSVFKEQAPPKPSPYERLRDGIILDFRKFNTDGTLPEGGISKLLSDITELRDTKLVPIPDPNDPNKTVMTLQQGVNMYDILEKEFGKEAVDKLRKLAGMETADTFITPGGSGTETEEKGKKFETINVGDTKFTILSTKDTKLGTTEVKTLTNAKSGLKDLNTALSLIFKGGKYNKAMVGTMNIAPTWSLGLIGGLTGSDIANDARTTIQSMQRAIEIILRERSGAAVPPAELENYLKLYLPSALDNEIQARNKIDALLQYFKGSIDGINKGRQKGGANEDPSFVNEKLPMKIKDQTMKEGGKIMGRLLKKQGNIMYIETAPGSGLFQPLVTKSN